MAPYNGVDTLAVRHIYKHMLEIIPEECKQVTELELALTPVLLDIENTGMALDMELLQKHSQAFPVTLYLIEKELEKLKEVEIEGITINFGNTNVDRAYKIAKEILNEAGLISGAVNAVKAGMNAVGVGGEEETETRKSQLSQLVKIMDTISTIAKKLEPLGFTIQ
jgi:hypothetical protein